MAARGVDTPLAMEGQEYVWAQLWRESGMARRNCREPFRRAVPAVAAHGQYRRLSRAAFGGWIERSTSLQGQILARMRALGMKPILPAFSGYVPEALPAASRGADLQDAGMGRLCADLLARSVRSAVCQLARRFIEIYNQTYGAGDYYLADAFNEMIRRLPRTASTRPTPNMATARQQRGSAAARAAALPPRARCAPGGLWRAALCLDHRRRATSDMGDAGLALRRGQGVLDARGDPRVPVPRAKRADAGARYRQ
jgi:alpha-N-acetylglucosaminidase